MLVVIANMSYCWMIMALLSCSTAEAAFDEPKLAEANARVDRIHIALEDSMAYFKE